MASEKISAMPDAGALTGAELVPVVRFGSPNLNLSTTVADIANSGSSLGIIEYINNTSGLPITFTLPSSHVTTTIKDDGFNATLFHITVVDPVGSLIDNSSSFVINQSGAAFTFVWQNARSKWNVF